MKNAIKYYYNISIEEINKLNNYYYFFINDKKYYLTIYNRSINELKSINELNKKMIASNILVHEIISSGRRKFIKFSYVIYNKNQ